MSTTDGRLLTTTSYAILGLLAARPWSTYALAKQMRRSLQHIWPRAESNIYAEPKRLVEAGLATAEVETVGKRARTVYSITDEGLRALVRWLSTESAPSRFESETLVKVLFGNYGTKDVLLANLRRFADEAAATRAFWKLVADDYIHGRHAFPERMHVNALVFRWNSEQAKTNESWAEWAIAQVESWADTATQADLEASFETFRAAL